MTRPLRLAWLVLGVFLMAGAFAFRAAAAPQLRTVLVVPGGKAAPRAALLDTRNCVRFPRTCVNGAAGLELSFALRGSAPARPVLARVLTDTDCAADRNGISHCKNVLQLPGRRLTVRHDHAMANDPCLAPGERVWVVSAAGFLRR